MCTRFGTFAAALSFAAVIVAWAAHANADTIATGPIDVDELEQGADGLVAIVVKLKDEPLARYRGGIAGIAATSPATTGVRRLDPGASSSRA